MKPLQLTPAQVDLLSYTIAHFQEIARQNRFAENSAVPHDVDRCVICHPDLLPGDPFHTYLDVVTQSIKIRRPALDEGLVEQINGDLAMAGETRRLTLDALRTGGDQAFELWKTWIREAMATGLGLVSVHSPTSLEFDLEEAEIQGHAAFIETKIEELMQYQREGRSQSPAA
ncbi:MAG: hypothetical protein AB9873_06085 [Syntrophobacteraceae bacterium]